MSSVDSLTRELEVAQRAGGGGNEEEENEWRKKCRDMEFQKNRVAVELSNAKFQVSSSHSLSFSSTHPRFALELALTHFLRSLASSSQVQELTQQLEASKRTPPPTHESTLPAARQHEIAINRWKVKVSDLLGEVEKEKNEKMELSSRLDALLAQG